MYNRVNPITIKTSFEPYKVIIIKSPMTITPSTIPLIILFIRVLRNESNDSNRDWISPTFLFRKSQGAISLSNQKAYFPLNIDQCIYK